MIGKVTTGFQITIPLKFREKSGISIGDYIDFREQNGKLIVEPIKINKGSKSEALAKFEKIFAKKITDKTFKNKSEDEVMRLVTKEIKAVRKKPKKNENRSRL